MKPPSSLVASSTPTAAADGPSAFGLRRVSVEELFMGAALVVIEHKGEHYQLRLTRNDKLILTK